MSAELVAAIEMQSVCAQQPFHARDQIGSWCLNNQMEMVAHQAPCVSEPIGLPTGVAQSFQKQDTSLVAAENVFAVISSIDNMINRAGVFMRSLEPRAINGSEWAILSICESNLI